MANGASGSDQVRARCSPAAAPPSGPRGRPGAGSQSAGFWCGVWARGGDWQLNKPANLSSRGRGYRRDLCRYPTQTLGAHRGRKRAAPRAASLDSGSPIARRISAFRAPRAPAAPPRPRAASAPISQTCARRRRGPPAPPTLCWARAGSTPSSEASSSAVAGKSQRSTKLTDKRWSPRAARARATRPPRARSAAAASRPTRSRPTRPSARPGPLGRTSLRPRSLRKRRTPTRLNQEEDVEELIEQEYR